MTLPAEVQPLPLIYKDPVLLRFEEHGDVGLASTGHFEFTRKAVAIPLCIGEFRHCYASLSDRLCNGRARLADRPDRHPARR